MKNANNFSAPDEKDLNINDGHSQKQTKEDGVHGYLISSVSVKGWKTCLIKEIIGWTKKKIEERKNEVYSLAVIIGLTSRKMPPSLETNIPYDEKSSQRCIGSVSLSTSEISTKPTRLNTEQVIEISDEITTATKLSFQELETNESQIRYLVWEYCDENMNIQVKPHKKRKRKNVQSFDPFSSKEMYLMSHSTKLSQNDNISRPKTRSRKKAVLILENAKRTITESKSLDEPENSYESQFRYSLKELYCDDDLNTPNIPDKKRKRKKPQICDPHVFTSKEMYSNPKLARFSSLKKKSFSSHDQSLNEIKAALHETNETLRMQLHVEFKRIMDDLELRVFGRRRNMTKLSQLLNTQIRFRFEDLDDIRLNIWSDEVKVIRNENRIFVRSKDKQSIENKQIWIRVVIGGHPCLEMPFYISF